MYCILNYSYRDKILIRKKNVKKKHTHTHERAWRQRTKNKCYDHMRGFRPTFGPLSVWEIRTGQGELKGWVFRKCRFSLVL